MALPSAHPSAAPSSTPVALPVRDIAPWAVLVLLLALVVVYFVSAEEGATAVLSNAYVHEFVHDGRHLLGFPCH